MSTKLIQKHFFRGITEFEIIGDQVEVRTKSKFTRDEKETLSVTLAVLNPEPIITRSHLEFISRVNGESLLSLELSRPNVKEFNNFVNTLKQKAQEEYDAISGISVIPQSATLNGNVYEDPPEFDEISAVNISNVKKVSVVGVENAINMLNTYVHDVEIQPLITALETLKQAPQDHSKLVEVATIFNGLESTQGAVLTYAPYITIMLSDDPFGAD